MMLEEASDKLFTASAVTEMLPNSVPYQKLCRAQKGVHTMPTAPARVAIGRAHRRFLRAASYRRTKRRTRNSVKQYHLPLP